MFLIEIARVVRVISSKGKLFSGASSSNLLKKLSINSFSYIFLKFYSMSSNNSLISLNNEEKFAMN